MNRFFRSALFPLIVIVLLVYLASQTLMRGGGKETQGLDVRADPGDQEQPDRISDVSIDPNKQKIKLHD